MFISFQFSTILMKAFLRDVIHFGALPTPSALEVIN